jgi:alkylmercury lyase
MTNLADFVLPQALGRSLGALFGLPPDAQLVTLDDLVGALGRGTPRPRVEDLTSDRPTRHEVRVDGRTLYTHCFVDALMLPFVLGSGQLEVRSTSPGSGEAIVVRLSEHGVQASPQTAVVSFGVARKPQGELQSVLCPYLNAFASREDYERWVADTPEAVTLALPLDDAFELAREWATSGEADAVEHRAPRRC